MQLLKHPETLTIFQHSHVTKHFRNQCEPKILGFQHHRTHFDSLIVSCAKGLKDYSVPFISTFIQ